MKTVIYAVSGGTSRTVYQALKTVLPQFFQSSEAIEERVEVIRKPGVRTRQEAIRIAEDAATANGLVFHTLFDAGVKQALEKRCRHEGVACIAILDQVESVLSRALQIEPEGKPGLPGTLYGGRFEHLDAIDFMLAHDDGLGITKIHKADVVLVGPSRASKSVTCLFLAYLHGVRAANVPIVHNIPIRDDLKRVDPGKVVALLMSARRLEEVRRARATKWSGTDMQRYTSFEACQLDVRATQQAATAHGWHRAYVSNLAVEEVVTKVLGLMARS